MNMELLRTIHAQANKIWESDELTAEDKFDLIFSQDISQAVHQEMHLDYYDPDTTYEEDVAAFMNAFNEKFERFAKVL